MRKNSQAVSQYETCDTVKYRFLSSTARNHIFLSRKLEDTPVLWQRCDAVLVSARE